MLLVKKGTSGSATISSSGTIVPLDTVVLRTNNSVSLADNAMQENEVGCYDTFCEVTLKNTSSSSPITVALTQYADGKAIPDAVVSTTIPASSTSTISLVWVVKVVGAYDSVAKTSWYVSGGDCELTAAHAKAFRYI